MFKSKKNSAYIIAEIGQNHQGELDLASSYINKMAEIGVDAVKFQVRDNTYLFSEEKLNSPYDNPNSFGPTYGEHRRRLELNFDDFKLLRQQAAEQNIDFICTAFDEPSLEFLVELKVDAIKVASFDFANLPFLSRVIEKNIPYIVSTGGANYELVDQCIRWMLDMGGRFALLHCVSKYPCNADDLNVGRVKYLNSKFPNLQIGLSDHYSGTLSGALGFVAGATVFEKHVTFNRSWKGTDHAFALNIDGMRKFVRDINRAQVMMGMEEPADLGNEYVFSKLGKSICAAQKISKGDVFSVHNLTGKIVGSGLPVRRSMELIGRSALKCYDVGDIIDTSEIFEIERSRERRDY